MGMQLILLFVGEAACAVAVSVAQCARCIRYWFDLTWLILAWALHTRVDRRAKIVWGQWH